MATEPRPLVPPSLRLHEVSVNLFRAIAEDPHEALRSLALVPSQSAEFLKMVAQQSAAFFESVRATSPWLGYLAIEADTNELVGSCGFKGNPNGKGEVEIAYCTLEHREGRGVATAMTSAICDLAGKHPAAQKAIAHTLPERNASCRVLEKNGFSRVGEVIDPEDGKVWRWERTLVRG